MDPASKDKECSKINGFSVHLYDKDWANSKLRFAVGTLKGEYEDGLWKRRVQTALIVKRELLEYGFVWQADRIDNWIHRLATSEIKKDRIRLQAAGLTSKREREEASF